MPRLVEREQHRVHYSTTQGHQAWRLHQLQADGGQCGQAGGRRCLLSRHSEATRSSSGRQLISLW